MSEYDSIETLKGLDHIRHRPGMYLGDYIGNGFNSSLCNMFREVLGNSVDEFMAGYGKKINISLDTSSNTLSVRDYGRGIPFTLNSEGVSQLEVAVGVPNSGAKYRKDQEGSNYTFSIGLNGIGVKAVCAVSEKFKATSFRGKKKASILYNRGSKSTFKESSTKEASGTLIEWSPDTSIINHQYNPKHIEKICHQTVYLNTHLSITLSIDGYEKTYKESKGIQSFLATRVKDSEVLVKSMSLSGKVEGSYEFDIALALTSASTEDIHPFINGNGIDESSAPVVSLRKGFAKAVKDYLTTVADVPKKYYDKNQKLLIETSDCRAGMVAIIKMLHIDPAFDSQSKTKLINKDISKFISDTISPQILGYLQKHPDQASLVVAQILIQADARIASKKARADVLTHKVKKHSDLNISLDIYTPPLKGKPEDNSLYIFEGQSASGSLIKASKSKNPETGTLYKNNVGILAFKGMALNTLELEMSKVLKNKEFATLIDVSGLNPNNPSDLSKLNFHQFIIACDSDAGGSHIATLILTFFFKHFPKVIEEGMLFRVSTPLFELRNLKTKDLHFIYAEENKEGRIKDLGFKIEDLNKTYTLKRNKGLGKCLIRLTSLWYRILDFNPFKRMKLMLSLKCSISSLEKITSKIEGI